MKTFFLFGAICGVLNIAGVFYINNCWFSALGWLTATLFLIAAYLGEKE